MYVFIEMGANPLLSTTDGRIGRIHVLRRGWKQDINPNKPLGEDGGRCPAVMLPLWSYKSKLLTPKPEAYHHLPS